MFEVVLNHLPEPSAEAPKDEPEAVIKQGKASAPTKKRGRVTTH